MKKTAALLSAVKRVTGCKRDVPQKLWRCYALRRMLVASLITCMYRATGTKTRHHQPHCVATSFEVRSSSCPTYLAKLLSPFPPIKDKCSTFVYMTLRSLPFTLKGMSWLKWVTKDKVRVSRDQVTNWTNWMRNILFIGMNSANTVYPQILMVSKFTNKMFTFASNECQYVCQDFSKPSPHCFCCHTWECVSYSCLHFIVMVPFTWLPLLLWQW